MTSDAYIIMTSDAYIIMTGFFLLILHSDNMTSDNI
jgi:hypothetical protein